MASPPIAVIVDNLAAHRIISGVVALSLVVVGELQAGSSVAVAWAPSGEVVARSAPPSGSSSSAT